VETVELRGVVARVIFSAKDRPYTIGALAVGDGKSGYEVCFLGEYALQEGDRVQLTGAYVDHPKHGRQLKVDGLTYDLDFTAEGLRLYLEKCKDFRGIGPARAQAIAERYGEGFGAAILADPAAVAREAGIPVAVAVALREAWIARAAFNDVVIALAGYGVTPGQVQRLVAVFGTKAAEVVRKSPYSLIGAVPGFGFQRVDAIALHINIDKEDPRRLEEGVFHTAREAAQQGHTWSTRADLLTAAIRLLKVDWPESPAKVEAALERLLAGGRLTKAGTLPDTGDEAISLPTVREAEEGLYRLFEEQGQRPGLFGPGREIADWLSRLYKDANTFTLGQKKALLITLSRRLSVVTGYAGTGKTHIIQTLCTLSGLRGIPVTLLAPTGKAAKRMSVAGHQGSTIHRALHGGRFEGAILVDEASMLDVVLAYELFSAIDWERSFVVLFGDPNQLPPVGPGNLLRDIVEEKLLAVAELTEVVRQAGVLQENALALLGGEARKTAERGERDELPWIRKDEYTEPEEAAAFVGKLFSRWIPERLGFKLEDVQLITPQRKGPLGVDELNRRLQEIYQRARGNDLGAVEPKGRARFYPGDRVVQCKNNYHLRGLVGDREVAVFNGETGTIEEVSDEGIVVDFGTPTHPHPVFYEPEDAQDLRLAYALTIHRAQGSEWPCVVLVVHKSHSVMLSRNLFYTGATRARQTLIVVGDSWGVREAARRTEAAKRRTLLAIAKRLVWAAQPLALPPPRARARAAAPAELLDAARFLGVEEGVTAAEIQAAYRRAAREHHPDAGGSHEAFLRLTEARDLLLSHEARR
jgi:exodeoxyribonuclease V alpha subunit